MINALYSGITGLNGFQTALNTESNNISNSNTVAFKSDQLSFADQMYQSGIGTGLMVQTIDKDFNQGNLKITNNSYDFAIDGKGFFIVQGETEELLFTRAGNFRMAADGTLQTAEALNVKGIASTPGDVISSDANTIFNSNYDQFIATQIVSSDTLGTFSFNAKTTDYKQSATNDDILTQTGQNYKSRITKIEDVTLLTTAFREALVAYADDPDATDVTPTNQVSTITFDTNSITPNSILEIQVGSNYLREVVYGTAEEALNSLTDSISAIKGVSAIYDDATGTLSVENMIPGEELIVADARIFQNGLPYNQTIITTDAVVGSGAANYLAIEQALKSAVETADAKYLRMVHGVGATDETLSDMQLNLLELGMSENQFGTLELKDGYLYMNEGGNRYSIGKLETAVFSNELGLNPQGNNLFSATTESGEMVRATFENTILSDTLEMSNSELGENLVNLMVYQRAFEASSKSVSTSDEFLKTAIALKK